MKQRRDIEDGPGARADTAHDQVGLGDGPNELEIMLCSWQAGLFGSGTIPLLPNLQDGSDLPQTLAGLECRISEMGLMNQVEKRGNAALHADLCKGGRQDEGDDIGKLARMLQKGAGQGATAPKRGIANHDPAALMNRRLKVHEITRQDAVRIRGDIEGDGALGGQVPTEGSCASGRFDEEIIGPHPDLPPELPDALTGGGIRGVEFVERDVSHCGRVLFQLLPSYCADKKVRTDRQRIDVDYGP
ncbi:hypothetical protein [Paracoccus fontiphilus]|uniref:Uncharacterized protein n=1 Tax=Paracoccus fontiphilus TaxID=1815556 RepID=A0ABV7IG41_9RHOB|nr:hypothetical protein [Paracoccus fontiphilus]